MSGRWQAHVDQVVRVEATPRPPLQPPPPVSASTGARWVPTAIGGGGLLIALALIAASPDGSGVLAGLVTGGALTAMGLGVWAYVRHANAAVGAIDPSTGGPAAVAFTARSVRTPKGGVMWFLDIVARDAADGFLVASTDDHVFELRSGGSGWAWVAGDRQAGRALVVALADGRVLRCRRVAAV